MTYYQGCCSTLYCHPDGCLQECIKTLRYADRTDDTALRCSDRISMLQILLFISLHPRHTPLLFYH